ncbi:hypothetical protein NMY22_g7500 [Coprinellus aureogranulatus]|nr:hypothetical protein NMY22_g7500 [Coprinellus aureogranulatus]
MANMKLLFALFASLFFVNTMAMSHYEAAEALEMRAEALEARAEQLQDLAAMYRRALTSIDDGAELVERGPFTSKPKANLHCDRSVPSKVCDRALEKVQKAYGKDKQWHKFKNGEIFVPRTMFGPQDPIRGVAVAFYNGSKRPINAPTLNVSLMI